MNIPTLYLDLLILLASVYPSGFSSSMDYLLRKEREVKIDITSLIFSSLTLVIIFISIVALKRDLLFLNLPPGIFYVSALFSVPLCFLLEYILNVTFTYFSTGKIHKGITIHSAWKTKLSLSLILLITITAVGEELIFRQVWFTILDRTFNFPLIITLLITSLFYGMNHLFFGLNSVLSKATTGLIYGGLYVFSGHSISIPIIAHVLQNLSLILITRKTIA